MATITPGSSGGVGGGEGGEPSSAGQVLNIQMDNVSVPVDEGVNTYADNLNFAPLNNGFATEITWATAVSGQTSQIHLDPGTYEVTIEMVPVFLGYTFTGNENVSAHVGPTGSASTQFGILPNPVWPPFGGEGPQPASVSRVISIPSSVNRQKIRFLVDVSAPETEYPADAIISLVAYIVKLS